MILAGVLVLLLAMDSDADYTPPPPPRTAYPDLVEIRASIPPDMDKVSVSNVLRDAASRAGCATPVVEMEATRPGEAMRARVWCRDAPKERRHAPDRR